MRRGYILLAIIMLAPLGPSASAKHSHQGQRIEYFKYAFLDRFGRIAFEVPPKTDCKDFSDGLARIEDDCGKAYSPCSFIDTQGKLTLKGLTHASDFSDGLACIKAPKKSGFIDKTGKFAIAPRFEDALDFREGLAPVMVNGKCGFVDKSGDIVIPPFFDNVSGFSEGLAAAATQGKVGFLDRSGHWQIQPRFDLVYGFSDGLSLVHDGNNRFFINHQGEPVIRLSDEQKRAPFFPVGSPTITLNSRPFIFAPFNSRPYGTAYAFSEGLAVSFDGKRFGYIDKTGKYAIPAKFDVAFPFSEGLAKVKIDKSYGFIDRTGRIIIEPVFKEAHDFSEGLAAIATESNKWGYINRYGKIIVEPQYIQARPFKNGLACVQLTGW